MREGGVSDRNRTEGPGGMRTRTAYVVQAFEKRRGEFLSLPKSEARSEAHALYQAEHIAARKAGAAVIAITADEETGEVSEAKILARYGDVPDDLSQLISSLSQR